MVQYTQGTLEMWLLLFSSLFIQTDSHSCGHIENKVQVSENVYFTLEDRNLFKQTANHRELLYRNITSFVVDPRKEELFFTNSTGLYNFSDLIVRQRSLRILALLDDHLVYLQEEPDLHFEDSL